MSLISFNPESLLSWLSLNANPPAPAGNTGSTPKAGPTVAPVPKDGFDPPAKKPAPAGVGASTFPGIPIPHYAVTSDEAHRSAKDYDAVLAQFKVGENPRYQKNRQGKNETYCNIFVEDATKAMGCQIPTAYDDKTGKPCSFDKQTGTFKGGYQHNANGCVDWLHKFGPGNGWKKVSAEQAQTMADQGHPAVAAWKNTGPGAGHLAMIHPSDGESFDPAKGPRISQAGGSNFEKGYLKDGFKGVADKTEIEYWVHE
jgi:hypothetical protein